MSTSVSALLAENYGIDIKPAGKADCPFCGHRSFYVKHDDTLGKCFHPTCGRFITPSSQERRYENGLHRAMEDIFQDFHASLLALASADTGPGNAYAYFVQERRIHPRVVADSMLGAVPLGYSCASRFDPIIAAIEAALKAENLRTSKDTGHSAGQDLRFLIEARDKFCHCAQRHEGWIAFFYTDTSHRIVAVRFREPYSKRISYFKPYTKVAGLFGHGLFTPYRSEGRKSLDDFLIVTEGEFNQLQLQSLSLRYGETTRQDPGYVFFLLCGRG